MNTDNLPVAVIGGGPVGLAAAAHLITRGVPVRLYESGESVAANVRSWGHVRLFSPWGFNIDPAAGWMLRERGWQEPSPEAMPTGRELVDAYLEPLAQLPAMASIIQTNTQVQAITRQGIDKVVTRDRDTRPVRTDRAEWQAAGRASNLHAPSSTPREHGRPPIHLVHPA